MEFINLANYEELVLKGYEDFNLKKRSCYKKKIYINTKDKKIFVFSWLVTQTCGKIN